MIEIAFCCGSPENCLERVADPHGCSRTVPDQLLVLVVAPRSNAMRQSWRKATSGSVTLPRWPVTGSGMMDRELRFRFLSERFFQIFTMPGEAIIGKTRHEFAGRAMEAAHWQAHYRDLNARKPFRSFEYDVTLPNEELRFIQISGKPVFGPDGTFKGCRGTGTDITELRLREQQLASERERLRRVMVEVSEKNSMLESLSGKLSACAA